jgi:branched-chain amino acid transport system substrate-binding protein
MHFRRQVAASIAIATASLLIAGCGGSGDSGSDGGSGGETVKIAFITEKTGFASFYGEQGEAGVRYAVNEINDAGGIDGKKIELKVYDDASDAGQAASLATQVAASDASALIFGVIGTEAQAVAPIAQKAGLGSVFYESSAPGLTEVGDAIYKITEPGNNFFPQVFDVAKQEYDPKTVSIIYGADNSSAVAQLEPTKKIIAEKGMTLVDTIPIKSTDTDFATVATKVVKGKPDMTLVLPSSSASASALIKSLRELGYKGGLAGGTGLIGGALKAAGDDAEGTLYPASFVASDQLPWQTGVDFSKGFEAANGSAPNAFHAEAHDALQFISEAVKASGGTSRKDILKGLAMVAEKGFTGAMGTVTFKDRLADTPGVVVEWKGGAETLAAAGS